jgi:small-conductance mechanosensitive channel
MLSALRESTMFGATALEWLQALGIGAGVAATLYAIRLLMVNKLKGAANTKVWVDDFFLLLAQRTSRIYMVAMGIAAGGAWVSANGALHTGLRIFTISAFCLQLLWWANASVDFWLGRMDQSTDGTTPAGGRASLAVVGMLIRAAIFVVVLVLALDNFGINVTALITGLGITGIAVALAVQNILGDLLAALAIAFDKPFVVGDEITVGDMTGRVERVGIKTTRLRLGTGEEVSIANSEVVKTRLMNVSRTRTRMLAMTIGVSANGVTGDELLALATRCEATAASIDGVRSAKARLQAVVDGRARVVVECVLNTPQELGTVRPLLVAALTDAASADGRPVLGVA